MGKQKYFYRWVILAGSFLLMAVPFSIINTIHTLFITPVTEEMGFSISAFSLIFTISAIVAAGISPLMGKLMNIVSIQIIMTASALMIGLGFIGYSFAGTIHIFYAISIVIAVGMSGLTMIPISTMITNWFAEQRGMAMGIAFAGAGLGTFFWMQIVSRLLQNYGYHYAYLMLGLLILLISVPIALLIVSRSPQDKYKLDDKNTGGHPESTQEAKADFRRIMQNPEFLPFAVGVLLMGVSITGVQIHLQSYLASLQYDLVYSANIGSTLAISALAGNIIGGIAFDRLDTRKTLLCFGSLALIALAALMVAEFPAVPHFFAVVFGLCLCLPSLWPSFGVGKIFKNENYSATLGIVNLFFIIGGAGGPFLSGLLADSSFGYKAAWPLYFVMTLFYLFLFIKPLRHQE